MRDVALKSAAIPAGSTAREVDDVTRRRRRIMSAVIEERKRQVQLFGEQLQRPLVQAGVGPEAMCVVYGLPSARVAKGTCERRAREGMLTYADVLVEEVCEVMECGTSSETDLQHMREELVQVAAVAMAWVESVEARLDALEDSQKTHTGGTDGK